MMKESSNVILFRIIALLALLSALALLFPFERSSSALRQARLAEQQGDHKAAAQLYTQASRTFFWDRIALQVKAAQNAAQADDPHQVIHLLSPWQDSASLPYPAQVLLAEAYLATNQPDAAFALWQEWMERGHPPESIGLPLLKIYTEQGRFERILPILRTLVAEQPQNAEWHYRLGLVLAAEAPQEARLPLQKATQLDARYQPSVSALVEQLAQPSSEPALLYLFGGRGLAAIGEWKLAERAFEHAVTQRPDYAEAWAYLGLARLRLAAKLTKSPLPKQTQTEEERNAKAPQKNRPGLAELRFALKLNPHSQVALAFLTLYWQELGETQLALQSAQQAFRIYPNDPTVRLQYAQALAQSGDLAGGWQLLNQWLEKSADPSAARRALVVYCIQYSYLLQESALPLAEELAGLSPKDAESLDLLGQVYLGLEQWLLAQEIFERVLALDTRYAPAWLHLGMTHLAQGNPALARTHFQKVLEIAPFSPSGEQAKRYLEVYLP